MVIQSNLNKPFDIVASTSGNTEVSKSTEVSYSECFYYLALKMAFCLLRWVFKALTAGRLRMMCRVYLESR